MNVLTQNLNNEIVLDPNKVDAYAVRDGDNEPRCRQITAQSSWWPTTAKNSRVPIGNFFKAIENCNQNPFRQVLQNYAKAEFRDISNL